MSDVLLVVSDVSEVLTKTQIIKIIELEQNNIALITAIVNWGPSNHVNCAQTKRMRNPIGVINFVLQHTKQVIPVT